jgi:hypothetical protein
MEAVTYIIVGAPGQNPFESVLDLIHLSKKNTLAGVSVYYPAPGSEDWGRYVDSYGLPDDFNILRSSAVPVSDTTSRLDSLTLLRLGRILNFSKDLMKKGIPIAPQPLDQELLFQAGRHDTGRRLLESFYHDGLIRGIGPDGRIHIHETSQSLCDMYKKETMDVFISK